ncbi:SGNH/GDSL hydrolase family protein [Arthrobacter sp. HS15c]|uniref:SGNH/GDSL hydrolase family protein n=1 Tax=Arthrobacter sp. HS15c TaxID=3230279 RepID=UPI0034664565
MRVGRIVAGAVAALTLVGGGSFAAPTVKNNIEQGQKCESIKARLPIVHIAETSVAILGDSYTAGDALEDRTKGWAYAVGSDLAGVGGTGFVNGGYCGNHTYGERLDGVLALRPQTLIIQGGLNDWDTAEKVADAAAAVLERADAVPRVLLFGPPDVPGRENESLVDQALRAAVSLSDAEYVSGLDWDLEYLADNTHLTPAGHATFAAKVRKAITD